MKAWKLFHRNQLREKPRADDQELSQYSGGNEFCIQVDYVPPPWKNIPLQIAILCRVKNSHHTSYIDEIKNSLSLHELPYTWITENAESKRNFIRDEHTIKISTIDSAKGLDFRVVFIINVENMPFPLEEVAEREVLFVLFRYDPGFGMAIPHL